MKPLAPHRKWRRTRQWKRRRRFHSDRSSECLTRRIWIIFQLSLVLEDKRRGKFQVFPTEIVTTNTKQLLSSRANKAEPIPSHCDDNDGQDDEELCDRRPSRCDNDANECEEHCDAVADDDDDDDNGNNFATSLGASCDIVPFKWSERHRKSLESECDSFSKRDNNLRSSSESRKPLAEVWSLELLAASQSRSRSESPSTRSARNRRMQTQWKGTTGNRSRMRLQRRLGRLAKRERVYYAFLLRLNILIARSSDFHESNACESDFSRAMLSLSSMERSGWKKAKQQSSDGNKLATKAKLDDAEQTHNRTALANLDKLRPPKLITPVRRASRDSSVGGPIISGSAPLLNGRRTRMKRSGDSCVAHLCSTTEAGRSADRAHVCRRDGCDCDCGAIKWPPATSTSFGAQIKPTLTDMDEKSGASENEKYNCISADLPNGNNNNEMNQRRRRRPTSSRTHSANAIAIEEDKCKCKCMRNRSGHLAASSPPPLLYDCIVVGRSHSMAANPLALQCRRAPSAIRDLTTAHKLSHYDYSDGSAGNCFLGYYCCRLGACSGDSANQHNNNNKEPPRSRRDHSKGVAATLAGRKKRPRSKRAGVSEVDRSRSGNPLCGLLWLLAAISATAAPSIIGPLPFPVSFAAAANAAAKGGKLAKTTIDTNERRENTNFSLLAPNDKIGEAVGLKLKVGRFGFFLNDDDDDGYETDSSHALKSHRQVARKTNNSPKRTTQFDRRDRKDRSVRTSPSGLSKSLSNRIAAMKARSHLDEEKSNRKRANNRSKRSDHWQQQLRSAMRLTSLMNKTTTHNEHVVSIVQQQQKQSYKNKQNKQTYSSHANGNCPLECQCVWKNGKQWADCTRWSSKMSEERLRAYDGRRKTHEDSTTSEDARRSYNLTTPSMYDEEPEKDDDDDEQDDNSTTRKFEELPVGLDPLLQVLNLSTSPLRTLNESVFVRHNLNNLQRIFLSK